jgi:rod shape-determining protein MreC
VFRFTRKTLFPVLRFVIPIIILSAFLPVLRTPIIAVLRAPLYLCSLIGREINGMVFYHRNYIQRDALARRMDHLNSRLASMAELSVENARLNNLLSLKQQLIGRDPSNWSSTVFINKGASSGIKKGAASVSFLGLAGRVMEVGPSVSKVMLINDPNVSVSARIERSRQEGLICGSLGGSLLLKLLPKDCDIVVGDTIITSGLTSVYPKGLLIGTVSAIARDFSGLSMYAVIRPAVDLSGLEELLIIAE